MSNTEVVYMRIPSDVKQAISERAVARGVQLSDIVSELLQAGLKADQLLKDVEIHKTSVHTLEAENRNLVAQVQACRHDLGIAREAWNELRGVMSRPSILRCQQCRYEPRLEEVLSGTCPQCGRAAYEVRPEFHEITPGEIIRTGLAAAGGIAIGTAILNALFGNHDTSGST